MIPSLTVKCLVLATVALTLGADPPDQLEADYQTLRMMETYLDTAVGRAGVMPESVRAFRRLLETDDADALFKRLIDEARPAGQLYALCGLYFADRAAFQEAAGRFRDSDVEVTTQFGCILNRETVGRLVWSSEPGVMRLARDEAPADWFSRHGSAEQHGFALDISGGGFCHLLRGTLWEDRSREP